MNKYIVAVIVAMISVFTTKADEGMWLLPWMNQKQIDDMHKAGLVLSKSDIDAINEVSLKDAIVIFGRGCTGSIISDNGLLITNHHCGFDAARALSSETNNILENGYWAYNHNMELPVNGLTATFLINVHDVTTQVRSALDHISDPVEYASTQSDLFDNLISQNVPEGYEGEVYSFFEGEQYLLMTYQVFNDVRLVATPPSSLGKFGGETDNWSWPRHTCDFMMFRVYTSPEGTPATYAKENIPLKPKYHLSISTQGYEEGDFAMIMGYPGSTTRYITSFETDQVMRIDNGVRIKVRETKLQTMKSYMDTDLAIYLAYVGKYYSSANYMKYSKEQNKALIQEQIPQQKQALEARFTDWATDSQKLILPRIQKIIDDRDSAWNAYVWMREVFLNSSEAMSIARSNYSLYTLLQRKNASPNTIESLISRLRLTAVDFYEGYYPEVDKAIMKSLIPIFQANVAEPYRLPLQDLMSNKRGYTIDDYVDDMFSKSMFTNPEKLSQFYSNPSLQVLETDPVFALTIAFVNHWQDLASELTLSNRMYETTMRDYISALKVMDSSLVEYPDANSSMRLSWGKVGGYSPRDGMMYKHYTTIDGLMDKKSETNTEFKVPEKLETLYKNKDYGQWVDRDGELHVCFMTNNDITGGNSGSPVMNAKGELIGLAFDGNQDGMGGDIFFKDSVQRSICVDIRYVLFLVEKYGNAYNILEELKIPNIK